MSITENTNNTNNTNSLDTLYKDLYEQVGDMGKQSRVLGDNLKQLYREFKIVDKQSRQKKKRPQVPLKLSKELETFLSVEHGQMMTKAAVMKHISSYIKEKKLQVEENRRQFIPNKALSKIFSIKKPKNMTFVEINKHVSHHLFK